MNPLKNLYKVGETYYIRYRANGKLIRSSLGTGSEREAIKRRDELYTRVKSLKTEQDVIYQVAKAKNLYNGKSFLVNDIWGHFEKYLERHNTSHLAIKAYERFSRGFINWCKREGIKNLCLVTDSDAQKYANYLNSTKLANKTYNEKINSIRRIFEAFKEEAGIINNPFRNKNIPRKPNGTISRKEFTVEEVERILSSFDNLNMPNKEELRVLFYLGVYTGMRLKDCSLLRWESVNLETDVITIIPAKTRRFGTVVHIPLLLKLKEQLLTALQWETDGYVLPNIAKRYNHSSQNVAYDATKIISDNGFNRKISKDSGENERRRSVPEYGFHSFRYTFITICAENDISLAVVQSIVGHINPKQTLHYTRLSNNYKQSAMRSFSLNGKGKTDIRSQIIDNLDKLREDQLPWLLEFINETLL